MSTRILLAIISTLLWEAILAAVVLFLLPQLEIHVPLPGLIALMVALGALAVISYRIGTDVLRKRPVTGLTSMLGSRGKVMSPLNPAGTVRIKGEVWEAVSSGSYIDAGEEVVVVGEDRLRLMVAPVKNRR